MPDTSLFAILVLEAPIRMLKKEVIRLRHARLATPLVRERGVLRPATWDEALEQAAAGFAAVRAKGRDAFGLFSCSKATNEMNYAAQKFARQVMGTNNVDSCNRT